MGNVRSPLPLSVQLHVHNKVGLIDAVRVAVDILESLEFPHRPRRGGYRSQALAALPLLSWGNKKKRGARMPYQHRAGEEATERRKHFGNAERKLTYRRRSRPIRQPRRYDYPPYPPRSHPPHGLLQSGHRRSVPESPPVRRTGIDGAVYLATVPRTGRRHDVVDRHVLAVRRGRGRRRFDAGSDVGVLETGGGGDVVEVRRRVRREGGGVGDLGGESRRDDSEEGRRELSEQDGPPERRR